MSTATLSSKGQLVIPNRFRKALHLQPGDTRNPKVTKIVPTPSSRAANRRLGGRLGKVGQERFHGLDQTPEGRILFGEIKCQGH